MKTCLVYRTLMTGMTLHLSQFVASDRKKLPGLVPEALTATGTRRVQKCPLFEIHHRAMALSSSMKSVRSRSRVRSVRKSWAIGARMRMRSSISAKMVRFHLVERRFEFLQF
jgi:hypothetical protein